MTCLVCTEKVCQTCQICVLNYATILCMCMHFRFPDFQDTWRANIITTSNDQEIQACRYICIVQLPNFCFALLCTALIYFYKTLNKITDNFDRFFHMDAPIHSQQQCSYFAKSFKNGLKLSKIGFCTGLCISFGPVHKYL